jgi:hypothetical protein
MLLIMEPVGQRGTRTEAEGREAYDRMLRWGDSLRERGLLLASESLKSLDAASRVAVRGGKPQVIDGPFAEAKEMAVALAAECPAAQWATVEVRPLAPCYE